METIRPMTPQERTALKTQARLLSDYDGLLFGIVMLGMTSAATFLFLSFALLKLISPFLPEFAEWALNLRADNYAFWACISALVLPSLFAFDFGRRDLRHRRRIKADLAAGVVSETDLIFVAAKRYKEPEHGMYLLFLRTEDDRVFVLYDHDSGGDDTDRPMLRPKTKLRRTHYPASLRSDYDWAGPTLRPKRAKPLTTFPNEWPEDDTFYDVPWDDLDRIFSD